MKKPILLVPAIIICLGVTAFAQTDNRLQISRRGLFTIVVPGSDSQTKHLDDSSVKGSSLTVKNGQIKYEVRYACECLNGSLGFMTISNDSGKSKIISRSNITLNIIGSEKLAHISGKQVIVEDSQHRTIYRSYENHTLFYDLTVTVPKSSVDTPEVTDFFNSFKVFANIEELAKANNDLRLRFDQTTGVMMLSRTEFTKYQLKVSTAPYPMKAREQRIQGIVNIAVIFDERGKVASAEVICGDPLLVVDPLDSARKATIKPVIIDGKPVKVEAVLSYSFRF